MPRNSSGTYSLPAGNPVVTATVISSSWANTTLADIATALSDSLSRSGDGAMTAPLLLPDGTAGIPSLSFSSDPDSGFFRSATDDISLTLGGTRRVEFATTGVYVVDGLVGSPAYSFLSDPDTGMYRGGANNIRFATNGTLRIQIADTFVEFLTGVAYFPDGAVSTPSLSFGNDPDTGLYRVSSGTLGASSNGTLVATLNETTGLTVNRPFALAGILTPATITANENNYNPTNLNLASVVRLSSDAVRQITGIATGFSGRTLLLVNVGSNEIGLMHEDVNSSAANRIISASATTLPMTAGDCVMLWYDGVSSRWRIFTWNQF